jgi:hypothetical protein
VGRADDEAVVIRAPLTVVGLVTTIVDELELGDPTDAPTVASDQVIVAAGAAPGSVVLDVAGVGEPRPTRIGLTRDQARKLARAILAITEPGR